MATGRLIHNLADLLRRDLRAVPGFRKAKSHLPGRELLEIGPSGGVGTGLLRFRLAKTVGLRQFLCVLTIPPWGVRMISVIALFSQHLFADDFRYAPNSNAAPANQLVVAGNACGPASLLSAFRYGSERWQRAGNALPGDTDKARMTSMIRVQGMRPSPHLGGRSRWSRSGVNIADLTDMANEMAAAQSLPRLNYEVLFLDGNETQEKLLRRVHQRLNRSLSKGLPPVISIRRFADRENSAGERSWTIIDGHFVTVIALPKKLGKHDRAFRVTYLDPWGGKKSDGWIAISERAFLRGSERDSSLAPCLEAVFPDAQVGKKRVRPGETSVLTLSAAMGCW